MDGKGYDINGNIVYELNKGKGYIKQYDYRGKWLSFEGYFLNGEKNGFCKEYSGDILLFEGEYKDGKRKGIGKEYDEKTGELKFEGEYLYNIKIKGKEYSKGRIIYEGEYLNNKKWSGTGYDQNGNIIT